MTVGVSAICWKLRNGVIFGKNKVSDPCVHVNLIIKLLHDWLILQINPRKRSLMMEVVRKVELIVGEVFKALLGWSTSCRITVG